MLNLFSRPSKPETEGKKELRPGHALQFSRDGLQVWRYWNVKSESHLESFEDTVEHVRLLVTDAIERQLVSDVPLCTFLSGGLDSSIITAIAAEKFQREGKEPLHTYSIDYEDNAKFFVPLHPKQQKHKCHLKNQRTFLSTLYKQLIKLLYLNV